MNDLDKLYRDRLIDRLHVAETNCRNAEACWRNAERDLERVDRKWDKALAERDEARAALAALVAALVSSSSYEAHESFRAARALLKAWEAK